MTTFLIIAAIAVFTIIGIDSALMERRSRRLIAQRKALRHRRS